MKALNIAIKIILLPLHIKKLLTMLGIIRKKGEYYDRTDREK